MADALRCDKCGAVSDRNGLLGWLHVDRPTGAPGISMWHEAEPPWDFCSDLCVSEFFAARQHAREEAMTRATQA